MTNAMKHCGKCAQSLPSSAFYERSSGGRSSDCKECIRQARREFRAEEGERINARRRERWIPKLRPEPKERFWKVVKKSSSCWLWQAGTFPDGYGCFWLEGKSVGAHRYSYELANGPIPDGLWVLHSCDTPLCVNPAHLLLGDHQQNVNERVERNPMIGENHPRTKYSDAQIREMRALHANGLSYRKIAALFGANSSYVGEIVTRKTRIYVD